MMIKDGEYVAKVIESRCELSADGAGYIVILQVQVQVGNEHVVITDRLYMFMGGLEPQDTERMFQYQRAILHDREGGGYKIEELVNGRLIKVLIKNKEIIAVKKFDSND